MNNDDILSFLLGCTIRGSILILVAAALAPLIRRVFGANSAHWVWLAALVGLFSPWLPRTPLSLANLLPTSPPPVERPLGANEFRGPMTMRLVDRATQSPVISFQPSQATSLARADYVMVPAPKRLDLEDFLVATWAGGALLMLARLAWRWRQTRQLLKSARRLTESEAAAIPAALPICMSLAISDRIAAPALAGVFRPRVLVPEGWLETLDPEALRAILLHECGHHQRRDLVWEWLFALARCVHWMNPLAWLAAHLARRERELACDAWVLERSRSPEQYGLALLEVIQRMGTGRRGNFGAVAMADRLSPVGLRLKQIRRFRRTPRWLSAMAWAPAVLLLGAFGTERFEARAEKPPKGEPDQGRFAIAIKETGPLAPMPLSKRPVEINSRILRLPQPVAQSLGLPIGADEKGVLKILEEKEQRELLKKLAATEGVEILAIPRLVTRSGQRTLFEQVETIRFPTSYEPSTTTPSIPIPMAVEAYDLGITMEAEPYAKAEDLVNLQVAPRITSLVGLEDASGNVTPKLDPAEGLDWFGRLRSWELPPGAQGVPAVTTSKSGAQFDLNSRQAALIHGRTDSDELSANGAPMINYVLLQARVSP